VNQDFDMFLMRIGAAGAEKPVARVDNGIGPRP
jgi:hypothetical protein